MSVGSLGTIKEPVTLLDAFGRHVEAYVRRRQFSRAELATRDAAPVLVDFPAEALRRADREARIPVGTYMGLSIFIDHELAPGAWKIAGQGRVEMAKSTFCQLTAEIMRQKGRTPLDDGEFGI